MLSTGPLHARQSGRATQDSAAAARKFSRVRSFSTRLPQLRGRVSSTLDRPTLNRQTAVATIVRIMDTTYMRVGSERYASKKAPDKKPTFGASSLRKEHVTVQGNTVRFAFRGKSGVQWQRQITDPQLARAVQLFMSQPGKRLFQVPSTRGGMSAVTERDVRSLLTEYGAKPKDFRTLHANRLLEAQLSRLPRPGTQHEAKKNLTSAVRQVAKELGHTPSVCRSSYLDGRRLESYASQLR
ncbi:MAG: hypothetical protein ACYTFN_22245 [Planctomycetota bacterium]